MRNNDCSKTLLSYFRSTQKNKQMKIAISGATGFIGTHLTRYLSGQGHEVAELRIVFIIIVLFFQIDNFIHQSFRYVLASVNTKSSVWICHDVFPSDVYF